MQSVVTLTDLPGIIGCDKSPMIGGYRPDVYATDAPITVTIIGEAKTKADLETLHTRSQIQTFLNFLILHGGGLFILATPWQARLEGASLITSLLPKDSQASVRVIVIDDVGSGDD